MELTTDKLFYPFQLNIKYFRAPIYDFEVTLEVKFYLMIQEIKKEALEILKKHLDDFPEEKKELIYCDDYEESLTFFADYLEGEEKRRINFLDHVLYKLKELYVDIYKDNISREKIKSQMSELRKDKLALRRKIIMIEK